MRSEIKLYINMADSRKRGCSSPTKKSTSPKKSKSFVWSDQNVSEFLSIMKEETILYNLDNAKTPKEKRSAYRHVAVKLEEKGIEIPLDSIINKWKKLKQQYKSHVDKKRKSGTGRSRHWKFFDDMDEICGHRDIIHPTALLDTSASPPAKNDDDGVVKDNDKDILHVEDDLEDEISDADKVNSDLRDEEKHNLSDEDDAEGTAANSVAYCDKDERHRKIKKLKDLVEKKEEIRDSKATLNRKEKKTKLEKSLEVLNKGFKEVAEKETERYIKLEEMRHKQDLEYQLKIRELENQRRREERQHELAIFQVLAQQPQQSRYTPPSIHFASPFQGYQDNMSVSGSSISDGDNPYFQQL